MSASHGIRTETQYELDAPVNLSEGERKLVIGGSLRLLLGRLDRGIRVYADDLIRIASYAYPDERKESST